MKHDPEKLPKSGKRETKAAEKERKRSARRSYQAEWHRRKKASQKATGAGTVSNYPAQPAEQIYDPRWYPQPGPQEEAIAARSITELFFGGARYGGKSDYLLGDYLQDVKEYGAAWRGVLFRKTFPQLEDLIVRSKEIYLKAFPGAYFAEQSKTWHFSNGAYLRMRSLDRDALADNYIGHAYTWIGWDELPTWPTITPYLKLMACLRSGGADVPVKRVRSSGNPGGVGHVWVKSRFVGNHNQYAWTIRRDDNTGTTLLFVPSRVDDNRIGLKNDPGYISRLRAVGGVSEALLKAWLDGDWDVIAGAYFDVWGPQHIRPENEVNIEPWWPCWIGGDWGFKHNSAFYWLTTDERGNVGIFDELVISGQSPKDLAEMLGNRSEGRKVEDFWLSPDAFAKRTDAETVGQQIGDELAPYGVPFPASASNDRIGGAQLMYNLLKQNKMWVSTKCPELINVLPAIIHDPDKQEQTLKMEGDDPYDGARYGVYSKLGPRARAIKSNLLDKITATDPTIRNIQAMMVAKRIQREDPGVMQPVRYNRRWPG